MMPTRLLLLLPLVCAYGCKKDPILPPPTGTGTATGNATGPEQCGDGKDNDGDGLLDCEDDDCIGNAACTETSCDNETDDDGDGFVDCADADCWGNGCPVSKAKIETAGSVSWKVASLDFAPTNSCSPNHLDTATITLNSPAGTMRYQSANGAGNWTTCNWSATKSVVKDVNFTPGSSFAAPRLILRSGFTVDAGCPIQDQRFLPLVVTLDEQPGMFGMRTGGGGQGAPWFGMTGNPTPYDSTAVNGPVHTTSSCNFNVTGNSVSSTWAGADVSFEYTLAGEVLTVTPP